LGRPRRGWTLTRNSGSLPPQVVRVRVKTLGIFLWWEEKAKNSMKIENKWGINLMFDRFFLSKWEFFSRPSYFLEFLHRHWYAMIDREWPALDEAFQTWLAADNFDADGVQRESLSVLTKKALNP